VSPDSARGRDGAPVARATVVLRTAFLALLVLAAGLGCSTTTAHRLPLASNPLRDEAETCERHCRSLLVPVSVCGPGEAVETPCDSAARYVDRDRYAACLDSCPGATAVDGASCPAPPAPGAVCEETRKANAGGIAGGVIAAAAIVISIVLVSAISSVAFSPLGRGPR
jgi:hypothetical protein